MEQVDNVMVDLETLGTRPGCVVLSIGAVAFDPAANTVGPHWYGVLSRGDCLNHGLVEEPDTVAWWGRQSPEAREVLDHASEAGLYLQEACQAFTDFLALVAGGEAAAKDSVRLWGNGAGFDNPILAELYNRLDRPTPWSFWNDRCYRTLKGLVPGPRLTRVGTYHNASDDAHSQAIHANLLLNKLHASLQG